MIVNKIYMLIFFIFQLTALQIQNTVGSNLNSSTQRMRYGLATEIVTNRLLEIRKLNKDENLAQLIAEACEVAVGQDQYVENCSFPENELQKRIREDTLADEKTAQEKNMLSSQYQGKFLKMLSEMNQAKDILEIGTYTGYGAVQLADTAFCENLVTLDVEPYYEQFLKSRLAGTPLQDKIRIMIGPADQSLVKLKNEGKQFDLVFIDADKDGYLNYYKYIMDNDLLKSTGTIACDNILWCGKTYRQSDNTGKVLHDFTEFVKKDNRVYQMILPIRDGMLLIKPKIIV